MVKDLDTSIKRPLISWRFSLKSTLIALTLIVMVLVFFVEPYLRLKRQDDALEALANERGSLKRDSSGNVTTIKCGIPNDGGDLVIGNYPIERITAFHKLKNLYLHKIVLASLEPISKLEKLETLGVYDCSIVNMKSVPELQVTRFVLQSEEQANQFPKMPKLKHLTIGHSRTGFWLTLPGGENGRASHMPPLEGYDFHQLKNFRTATNVDLLLLVITNFDGFERFEKLESLILHGCELFSFKGLEDLMSLTSIEFSAISPNAPDLATLDLAPLQKCKSLTELVFPASAPEEVVKRFQESLPNCKVFAKQK